MESASATEPEDPIRSTLSQGSDIPILPSRERSGSKSRYRSTASRSALIDDRQIPKSLNGQRNDPKSQREKKRKRKVQTVRFADAENKPLVTVYSFKRDSAPVSYRVNPKPDQPAPYLQPISNSQLPPLQRHPTAFDMRRQFATYGNPNGGIPLRSTKSQPYLRDNSRSSRNWPGPDPGVGLSGGYSRSSIYAPRIPQKQPTLRRSKSQMQLNDRSRSAYDWSSRDRKIPGSGVPAHTPRDSSKPKSRAEPVLRPSKSQPDIRALSGSSDPRGWPGPGRQITRPKVHALPGPPLQHQWSQSDIGSRGSIQEYDPKSAQKNSSRSMGIIPELKAGIRNLLKKKKSAIF
ncbi:hypothetical protein Ddc_19381 [Ditylenchus destructor]|nr:hypothetical protein Ddc_19381 [Ditylenchus destructor]